MSQPFPLSLQRTEVPVGIGPPNKYYVPLQNSADLPTYEPPLDFTTVTSVNLAVTREWDLSTATWATSVLQSVTTAGLVAVYSFQLADCPVPGRYLVRPYAITAGGNVPMPLVFLYVRPV